MQTQVLNVRTADVYDIYIGRSKTVTGQPSRWGNPFSHRTGTAAQYVVATRDEAIAKYREWLWEQLQGPGGTALLEQLAELHGKRLACHCKPLACHGDVLASAAAWAVKEVQS